MDNKEKLTNDLKSLFYEIRDLVSTRKWKTSSSEHSEKWANMVDMATKLHKIVRPKHHKYMIENRGCSPDDPEFYNHIHPVEDLLAYIDNPKANDDPEDQTIDHQFTLKVYSRRWGHHDTYRITRTATGWDIAHISINGTCDKGGNPYLFSNLNQDSINYPEELSGYMSWLWNQAAERGLTHGEVQDALDKLGEWISVCEKDSPGGIWQSYK